MNLSAWRAIRIRTPNRARAANNARGSFLLTIVIQVGMEDDSTYLDSAAPSSSTSQWPHEGAEDQIFWQASQSGSDALNRLMSEAFLPRRRERTS